MRVLIINTFYAPNMPGGAEHSTKLLAEGLKKSGHDVCVFSIDTDEKYINEKIDGIDIVRARAGKFNINSRLSGSENKSVKLKNKLLEMRNYGIKEPLLKVIDEFKPDVVHTNNIYGISPYIYSLIHKKGIRIVHTLRDYWYLSPTVDLSIEDDNRFLIKNILKIHRSYFKKATRYVDVVTAPSKFTLDKFIKEEYFVNSKKAHVNNSVEIDMKEVVDKINIKKQNNSNIVNFIFVGMLKEIKGIDKLLEVFSNLKLENIRLNICGSGSLEDTVKSFEKRDHRISYKGKLSSEELSKEFSKNDVLIIPSMWDEPFGRVVIEANINGLPVIGSDRGGIKEILETIKTGELFDSNNLDELRKLIEEFSQRKNLQKYYDRIENNILLYDINKQIEEFVSLYSNTNMGE